MKIIKIASITAAILILGGCTDHYRYACQDIKNWNQPQCQKPLCMINQECPEDVLGPEIMAEIQRQTKDKGARQ